MHQLQRHNIDNERLLVISVVAYPMAVWTLLSAHRMRSNCNNYGRKKTSKNNLGANLFSISKIIAVFADWRVKGK